MAAAGSRLGEGDTSVLMVTNPVPNLNWPFRRLGERVSSAGARALRRVAGGSAVTRDLELRRRQMALRRRERERAGTQVAGPGTEYRGYRIWREGESWRTGADPESVFESQADAKAFVKSLKNPHSEFGAHLVEEKQPGWGPTFDISHWTRAARKAAEGVRYAQVYELSRGKVLVEFPKHVRTAHVLEDLEEVRSREEGNPNLSPSPEHLAAAQVAAQQARTGRWGVEIDHPNRRKRLHVSRSESPADTFLATVQPIKRGMGSRAKWRDKVIQDRNLESEIQHFLATGRLR